MRRLICFCREKTVKSQANMVISIFECEEIEHEILFIHTSGCASREEEIYSYVVTSMFRYL